MAQRDEIVSFLDSYMQKEKFKDYLPIGLQIEGRAEVQKVATAVSVSVDVIQQAAEWGADLLLVHHGLFWEKSDPVLRGHHKARVRALLLNDMTLMGYHLPLDAHPEAGNNILFARAMGFRYIEPFGDYHGTLIGWKGRFDPVPALTFAARAEAFYGVQPTTVFYCGKTTIETAAIVSGGAWDFITDAAREGIDCFVTGNADEPVYHLAREEQIHFLAFGHHATERPGVQCLGDLLARKFGVETQFFDVDNPL